MVDAREDWALQSQSSDCRLSWSHLSVETPIDCIGSKNLGIMHTESRRPVRALARPLRIANISSIIVVNETTEVHRHRTGDPTFAAVLSDQNPSSDLFASSK